MWVWWLDNLLPWSSFTFLLLFSTLCFCQCSQVLVENMVSKRQLFHHAFCPASLMQQQPKQFFSFSFTITHSSMCTKKVPCSAWASPLQCPTIWASTLAACSSLNWLGFCLLAPASCCSVGELVPNRRYWNCRLGLKETSRGVCLSFVLSARRLHLVLGNVDKILVFWNIPWYLIIIFIN